MKVWVEFPESTRFAKIKSDILYTPVFFANEGIHAFLKFDDEWEQSYNLADLDAKVTLYGRASLGFLSIGGRPAGGFDTRYALPEVGFRPIYTLDILEVPQRISLEPGRNRYPFSFTLPTSTLNEVQQLASSLKIITSDAKTSMSFLKDVSPALIVSVTYLISAEIAPEGVKKTVSNQEIRIFIGLTSEQAPTITPEITARNPMAEVVTTQIVPLVKTKRRQSIPLIRRMSRTQSTTSEDPYIIVEATEPAPFTFRRSDDAAATELQIKLTYHGGDSDSDAPPPTIVASATWLLRSLTSLTLEPVRRNGQAEPEQTEDYFNLRAKILPIRKNRLTWSNWTKTKPPAPSTSSTGESLSQTQSHLHLNPSGPPRWTATQPLWLTQPLTSLLPPSFTTSYLTHLYILHLSLNISLESSRSTPFSSSKPNVELTVPLQVRYELGLAPSYEVDESLPEYDYTLPRYSEDLERTGGAYIHPHGAVRYDFDNGTGNENENINANGGANTLIPDMSLHPGDIVDNGPIEETENTNTSGPGLGSTDTNTGRNPNMDNTTQQQQLQSQQNQQSQANQSSQYETMTPPVLAALYENQRGINVINEDDDDDEVMAALMRRVATMPVRRNREYGND